MKIRRLKKGFALIVTLFFIGVTLIAVASVIVWASSSAKVTGRNNQFVSSQYAAEAATETVLSQMMSDFQSQSMSNSTYYSKLIPTNFIGNWPVQYQFSDQFSSPGTNIVNQTYVNSGTTTANLSPLPPPYSGLSAYSQLCQIASTATPMNQLYNVPATVHETFLAATIPIFQFLIFYNINLEIAAAQTLNATGPVFSNQGLWSGSSKVTFSSTVWAVGQAYNQTDDPFANYTGTLANYTLAGQPASGKNSLNLPVAGSNNTNNSPTAIESLLQWPTNTYGFGTTAAYTTNGQIYFANEADLVISNTAYGTNYATLQPIGTNFVVYYQDPFASGGPLFQLTNDFYVLKKTNSQVPLSPTNYVPPTQYTNITYASFSFLTNVLFYDWREGWNGGSGPAKTVQAVQFDVMRFNAWLNGTNYAAGTITTNLNSGKYFNSLCMNSSHKNHPIDGIYVYTAIPLSKTVLPAVRVVNGQQLPTKWGLTVATPVPLYVKGNYNVQNDSGSSTGADVTHTWPAGLIGDAITVLSGSWTDTVSNQLPNASTTNIVNAACMAGIVPSDLTINTSDGASYSGGVENFLRMLESWGSSRNLVYNGSIVVMFPSQYATNRWRQTGYFYAAPNRIWAFDTNFDVEADLPPMTPGVKSIVRTAWAGH